MLLLLFYFFYFLFFFFFYVLLLLFLFFFAGRIRDERRVLDGFDAWTHLHARREEATTRAGAAARARMLRLSVRGGASSHVAVGVELVPLLSRRFATCTSTCVCARRQERGFVDVQWTHRTLLQRLQAMPMLRFRLLATHAKLLGQRERRFARHVRVARALGRNEAIRGGRRATSEHRRRVAFHVARVVANRTDPRGNTTTK